MDHVLADREAARAVRHHALALRRADRRAQIGLARQARLALPAFRRVQRNDVIALLQRSHAAADVDDDAGAFVTEDHREQAFGIRARARELIGVADAGRLDLDEHFAGARSVEIDGGDFERLAGGISDCGLGLHRSTLAAECATAAVRACSGMRFAAHRPRADARPSGSPRRPCRSRRAAARESSRECSRTLCLVAGDPLVERVLPFLLAEAHAHRDLVVELDLVDPA